ncbi:MAG: glyoxylate/hydroxypyruvate reductase A [Pseudomonadota bacterium]
MLNILFAARAEKWEDYEVPLSQAFSRAGMTARIATAVKPADVDYIVYAPNSSVQDFTPYTRLKAVLNLWAGVEAVVNNATLKVPLTRMADEGMTAGMVDYVVAHVMRYHVGLDAHVSNPDHVWDDTPPPLARHRSVGFLGIGALGGACAQAVAGLGFDVHGWSRTQKSLHGIACHSGSGGLKQILSLSEILVLLLPYTPQTENTLNAETLGWLPKGANVINPGRGPLIDDNALLAALESGQLGAATLDVFRQEPLPKDHAYWSHPKVTVTPHIASTTRPDLASERVVENIRLNEAGRPMLDVVDRSAGY